jgi:two-component system, cell cycle sensor histidine kinase and response regulator CckA
MTPKPLRILHLEDSPNDAWLIASLLQEEFQDLVIVQVDGRADFLKEIRNPEVRLVLSDYSLPAYDGISALSAARQVRPELPFLFVSGAMGEDMAVECMKIGATDYVLKSNLKRLPAAIRRALSELDTRLALMEAARVAKVVPWQWNEANDTWLFGYLVRDVLGYGSEVLKSSPGFLKAKVHVEDLPRFVASFDLARGRDRMEFDCRLLHLEERWVWTRWTLAWVDGKCRGILQDITELHATQEALIQSQRLETLGLMIGGITHDFGNLIGAMNGAVELLSLDPLTAAQRRHVELLVRSCARALTFKDDLLRLARKEDAPARHPAALEEIAREAVSLLSHAVSKNTELVCELSAEAPPVRCVPAQLLQVFMNLGINARDAMGDRGRITLRTGTLALSEGEAMESHRPGGRYAYIEVEDTGPGISPEIMARMFDPFFTTKTKDKGTGLGLAMVRAIVLQHDGLLQVFTRAGGGACFRILLPLTEDLQPLQVR